MNMDGRHTMGTMDGRHTIGGIPWAPWMGGTPLAAYHGYLDSWHQMYHSGMGMLQCHLKHSMTTELLSAM
jgi:hypothetical protein